MRSFRDSSIGSKLTFLIMATSSSALLLACLAVGAYDMLDLRRSMASDLHVIAAIVGENSTAALTFNDANAARDVLSALRSEPHVRSACIFTRDGRQFARYARLPSDPDLCPLLRPEGSYFTSDRLLQFHTISLAGESLGLVFIDSDLQELASRRYRYLAIVAAVLAGNGREALALWQTQKFDLLFMDVQMPELDGFAATAEIRRREQPAGDHLPIVAMTAHALKGDRERCLAAGMDGYISKPVKFELVQQEIERLCGAPAPLSTSSWTPEKALARVDGDLDLLRKVTSVFLDEYPNTMQHLRAALQQTDLQAMRELIHMLQGELSYFALEPAMAQLRLLQQKVHEGDPQAAGPSLQRLQDELDSARPRLLQLLEVQHEGAGRRG